MTKVQIFIYLSFILSQIFGISTIIEFYKKAIRKDKAKIWEIRIIALLLSMIAIAILPLLHIFKPVLGLIGAPLWSDFVFYTIVYYYCQRQVDMKLIKKAFASIIRTLLKRVFLEDDQIEAILTGTKLIEK